MVTFRFTKQKSDNLAKSMNDLHVILFDRDKNDCVFQNAASVESAIPLIRFFLLPYWLLSQRIPFWINFNNFFHQFLSFRWQNLISLLTLFHKCILNYLSRR